MLVVGHLPDGNHAPLWVAVVWLMSMLLLFWVLGRGAYRAQHREKAEEERKERIRAARQAGRR